MADRGHSPREQRLISDAFHEAAAKVFRFYAAAAADLEVVIPAAVSHSNPGINGYLDPAASVVLL